MPLVDMPLEELLKYEGCTPVPADFDEFWKRSLEEMKNTPREVRLEKAEFQAPGVNCYHLWFKGVRNARIHAKLLIPEDAEKGKVKAPALLRFHGYSGYCGPFSEYVGLAKCGFVVAALDARGQGGLSEDTGGSYGRTFHGQIIRGLSDCPENLIFRHIFLDTAELADIVMSFDFVDETRVGAYGNSQGGALTIACASLEPRIAKAFPIHPFLCDYKRVWDMDLAKNAYGEITEYFRFFDPRHEHEEEIFTRLGYIDLKNMTKWIKAEVVLATGLMDTICPPSTQFSAYNKITSKKRYLIYPDFGHEDLHDVNDEIYKFFFEFLEA